MTREEIFQLCERKVLKSAACLYKTEQNKLKVTPEYEGAANLVYEYHIDGLPMILRISFRPDRTADQIRAELDFVAHLAAGGLRVSLPVPSQEENLVETIDADGIPFHIVSFVKGVGMRVPDNGYRYRDDAPIEEYFHNWGKTLGKMHALSKNFQPANDKEKRPTWFELHKVRLGIVDRLPPRLSKVRERIHALLEKIDSLSKEKETYGLIHGDFNDGNFTVDYSNGNITVFDFDDCCYFHHTYELASAWEGGIGRVMFRELNERVAFMDHYMDILLDGYKQENEPEAGALALLPDFISLVQVEEFLHFTQYMDTPDDEIQAGLRYKIKCIEDDIPYMGFFNPIYNPDQPFSYN